MVYWQQRIISFYLISIILVCFIFPGESASVKSDNDLALPPVPEHETIETRKLEFSLPNGTYADCSTEEEALPPRGLISRRRRWKKFNVYPDPSFSESERTLINNAMYRLSLAVPCLSFGIFGPGSRPSGDYVHIRKIPGKGCRAAVGRRGGPQMMNLASPNCTNMGTILHEMVHALGFYHEQSRPDRDDYVTIHPENIKPAHLHNFEKKLASLVTSFGIRYNPRSIMHYHRRAFTRNGQPTITAKDGGEMGSTRELQSTDIEKLRRMYKCK